MSEPVVRIHLANDNRSVRIEALRPERLSIRGFGTFIDNIQPGEISISREARDALMQRRYQHGLMGFEIFAGNKIAWKTRQPKVTIDLNKVSRGPDTEWFLDCCVVEAVLSG